MPAYIIGYDLNTPGKDYEDLSEAIKGYGTWWHHLDSTWIIVTDQTHVEVRDHLWRFMDDNDEVLVAQLAGNAAWRGFSDEGQGGWQGLWRSLDLRTYATGPGPTRSPRRAGLGVGAIRKAVTSAGIEARDPLVGSVVVRAVVVAGRVAVVKGAIVAAQGRGAGIMEGAPNKGHLLRKVCA